MPTAKWVDDNAIRTIGPIIDSSGSSESVIQLHRDMATNGAN